MMTFLSKGLAVIAALVSFAAFAETTITFDDGTVVYLEPGQSVYVADQEVYLLTELEPVTGVSETPEEPLPQGSEEWCEWFLEVNGGTVVPSFDEGYYIYTNNCRD